MFTMKPIHRRLAPALLAGLACINYGADLRAQVSYAASMNTVLGTGISGYTGDGGPGIKAQISTGLRQIAVDQQGNVYATDYSYNVVRRVDARTGIVTTVAGNGTVCSNPTVATGACGDGGLATAAQLDNDRGITIDANGNIYIADYSGLRVRKVNAATGIITTIAGNGAQCYGPATNACGDGIVATSAQLTNPSALAVDGLGNLYIADDYDYKIRKVVLSTGIISTVAGTGKAAFSGDGGPAVSAAIQPVTGLACDSFGNLYIAETDFRVRMIRASDKTISTIAGTGTSGNTGNGGPAISAQLGSAYNLAVDPNGNVYIADAGSTSNEIREIVATSTGASPTFGNIVLVAGTGVNASAGDGGPPLKATFSDPDGIAIDSLGNIFVSDTGGARVRKISLTIPLPATAVGATTSSSTTFDIYTTNAVTYTSSSFPSGFSEFIAGSLSGCTLNSTTAAGTTCGIPFTFTPRYPGIRTAPYYLTDSSGNVYTLGVSAYGLAPQIAYASGTVTTTAGTGSPAFSGDGSLASAAVLSAPAGTVVDNANNIYIADAGNNVIRRIDGATGKIATVAGMGGSNGFTGDNGPAISATLNKPQSVALDAAGNLYIADTGNHAIRRVLSSTGVISTVAGGNGNGTGGDGGPAVSAKLSSPAGVTADITGNLYIADTGNNLVRRLNTSTGIITTIGGTGTAGNTGDGSNATAAQLNAPVGLALTANGLLYVSNSGANTVRLINLNTGLISTAAGTGNAGFSGDGALATQAQLKNPLDIAVDAAGDLTIADAGNHVVRRVDVATGVINTVAGNTQSGYSGDGSSATAAALTTPFGIALDAGANLFIADQDSNVLRHIDSSKGATIAFGNQGLFATSAAKSLLISNTGNQALTLSNVTVTGNFKQVTSGSGNCATGTVLPSGASCSVTIDFEPLVTGTATGAITVTDNTLNSTGTQTTPISATGVASTNATLKATAGNNQAVKLNTVLAIPTQVLVTDANGTGLAGQVITFTAPTSGASGTFAGSASSATAITDANGYATAPTFTANTTTGPYVVTASFASAANTVSFNLTNVINQYPTTTLLNIRPTGGSFQYGQALTLSATVAPTSQNGSTLSGSVYFYDDTTVLATVAVTNGSATYVQQASAIGNHNYQAVYEGDLNFSPSASAVIPITFTKAPTTLLSNQASVYYGQSAVTLTFTGPFSGGPILPPSGNVSYVIGSGTAVNSTLAGGKLSVNVPLTLAAGSYLVTISYPGDGNYQPATLTATLTILTPSFTIAVSSNALTLPLGGSVSDNLTVTPLGNLPGSVSFSCSGLPLYTACVFNTVAVNINNPANTLVFNGSSTPQTVQFTVVSQSNVSTLHQPSILVLACTLPSIFGLGLFARRSRLKLSIPAVVVFGVLSLIGLQGCGSGKTAAPGPFTGTTTFTITATGSDNNVVQTATITLTVPSS